jgi:acyl phosphate:glycerol-3-phosphate acyltransferase
MRGLLRSAVLGYAIGTFPSADLVARRVSRGTIDLRRSGSGNPGGANAVNVLGRRAGYSIMVADIGKGALACTAARAVGGATGAHVAGVGAVVGHCFPVWKGFRGGKGVGASVGQCLATFPAYFPIDLAVAAATAANPRWKQRAFAATSVASVCWVLGGCVWWLKRLPNLWGPRPSAALPLASAASSAVILYKFVTARPPVPGLAVVHEVSAA